METLVSPHPGGDGSEAAFQGERERTYFAVLYMPGRVEEVSGKGHVTRLCLRPEGDTKDCFRLPKKHRGKPMSWYLGKPCVLRLWPRTRPDGTLDSKLVGFGGLFPEPAHGSPPYFQLRGRLVAVDREAGTFGVEIRPNPKGKLKEAFRLTLWASLAFLEGLPPLGQGVYVRGEYRPRSRRLVALEARPMPLWDDPA